MPENESILLVDDDQGFLQVARLILQAKGFRVSTASRGTQAVALARDSFYNAAVLDIGLPDIEGTELLPRLLDTSPDTLVVMLTGRSSVQNAVQSLNRGAFAYLEKPLDPDHLLSVISRGLEKQRLSRENQRLLAELEKRNRETGILLSVAQAVSQSLEFKPVIDTALKRAVDLVELDAGCVHLVGKGVLTLEGYCGFSREIMDKLARIEMRPGLITTGCLQLDPVVIRCINGSTDPVLSLLKASGYHSYIGVPLAAGGRAVGILGMANLDERSFSDRDIELLIAVGRQIAIGINNAQLYEEASSARALRELDSMRTELLANVSHELRTPLAAIKGFASSLLQPDVCFDDETRYSFLQTIDHEADRLNRLIEGLLTMSRIEAGTFEVKQDWHGLDEIIDSVKDTLYSLTLKHHIKFSVLESLPRLFVDDARIGQVLTNLVENAAKYSPEGSEITIEARRQENAVVISVSDRGIGIPSEYHDKLFQRFCRIENDGARRPGSGLGLCICRGIVEKHGGRMWLQSEPGEGSKFSFSLPLSEEKDHGQDTHSRC